MPTAMIEAAPPIPNPLSRARSADAESLRKESERLWAETDLSISITMSQRFQAIYEALAAEARALEENLGANEAPPVDPLAIYYAFNLLTLLPQWIPLPTDVAIDSDGDVALEWDYAPRILISVRVAKDGVINFAGASGERFRGSGVLFEGMPRNVANAIERVVFAAGART